MANKRDNSKQKRAKQNRAQRDALKARTETASGVRPSRTAPAAKAKASSGGSGSGDTADAKPRGGFFSRERTLRPGDVPVDVETLEGGFFAKRVQVPGGRQILTAMLLTIVLSVMLAFTKFPSKADEALAERTGEDVVPTLSMLERFGAWSILVVGLPILIVGIAVLFTLHPRRRRIWIACTMLLGLTVVAAFTLYFVFFIPVGYLLYAVQRAIKIEGPGRTLSTLREPAESGPS